MSYKLLHHADKIREGYPISLSIAATGRCNLNCSFCYIKNRNKEDLLLDKIIYVIENLPTLESVEIGMGEPTLYPQINELIDQCHFYGLSVGIATNGIALQNIKEKIWEKVDWVILALTHFIDNGIKKKFNFPGWHTKINPVYVFNENSPNAKKVDELLSWYYINNDGFYDIEVKLDINYKQNIYRKDIANKYYNLKFGSENDVYKFTEPDYKFLPYEGECPYVSLKPMLYNDGYIYGCCVAVENGNYPEWNRICKWDEVSTDKLAYCDKQRKCPKCSKTERIQMINYFKEDQHPGFII